MPDPVLLTGKRQWGSPSTVHGILPRSCSTSHSGTPPAGSGCKRDLTVTKGPHKHTPWLPHTHTLHGGQAGMNPGPRQPQRSLPGCRGPRSPTAGRGSRDSQALDLGDGLLPRELHPAQVLPADTVVPPAHQLRLRGPGPAHLLQVAQQGRHHDQQGKHRVPGSWKRWDSVSLGGPGRGSAPSPPHAPWPRVSRRKLRPRQTRREHTGRCHLRRGGRVRDVRPQVRSWSRPSPARTYRRRERTPSAASRRGSR